MHRALAIEEVLRLIVDETCSHVDLVALTRVSRAFSEPALDLLWAEPPLWHLAVLMDARLWCETIERKRGVFMNGMIYHTMVCLRL
jgi:hypothetical protein